MRPRHYGQEPVATYDDALSWLFTHSDIEAWIFHGAELEEKPPLEARLVAAMFWVNEDQLARDMRRIWNRAVGRETPPPPYRRLQRTGWR